ncbi:MAG TPA: cytochrome b [Gammaproteobacteria bacterium]|nr:cytochrome b [Gammaproteobacteria bacterium]
MTQLPLRNDSTYYGLIAVLLHWLMAMLVIGLFALGLYIADLDYYDRWYIQGPAWHFGLGVATALLLVIRLGWRLSNPRPRMTGRPWEQRAALQVQRLFYALIAAIVISGYLTTTADGKPLPVFGWIDIPATFHGYPNQEDITGKAHEWLAWALMALAVLHSLAALKHHFFDRDATLRRMLRPGKPRPSSHNSR